MPKSERITSVNFTQFKAFARYALSLEHMNILVGPNNSGKSTIIGAVRALAAALRVARSRTPERIELPEGWRAGYRLNESSLPISLENVHTDYDSVDSKITFTLNNGNKLHLVFPSSEGCFLVPEVPGETIRSVAAFKRYFPIMLTVVPVLGLLNTENDGGSSTQLFLRFQRTAPHGISEATGITFRMISRDLAILSEKLGREWTFRAPR